MGSDKSTKRKKKDKPLLRLPQTFAAPAPSTSGGGSGGSYSEQCPVTFQVKVRDLPFIKKGTSVYLEKKGDRYAVKVLNNEIAVLNKSKSATVKECGELGINYSGQIEILKEGKYARFYRKTK